jgi:hypothetical protein
MNTKEYKLLLLLSILAIIAFAPAGFGDYQIIQSTIGGGGGTSAGGQYSLTGTIGQPAVGYSEGGNYVLLSGFWPGGPLCLIGFDDFARFAEYWLQTGSNLPADLDGDGIVNLYDLKLLADEWLCLCPYNWPLN